MTKEGSAVTVKHQVESADIDSMTLDNLQQFIDEAKAIGIAGNSKIRVVGKNEGYHFTGTYKFTPKGVRAGYEVDG